MTFKRNILITGGAGFIGSHVICLFINKYQCNGNSFLVARIWEVRPERYEGKRFYHISTDEICVLQVDGTCFTEFTKYDTHRLYSTNKASSDYFVRDYMR